MAVLVLVQAKEALLGVDTKAVGVIVAAGQTVGEASAEIVATGFTKAKTCNGAPLHEDALGVMV